VQFLILGMEEKDYMWESIMDNKGKDLHFIQVNVSTPNMARVYYETIETMFMEILRCNCQQS